MDAHSSGELAATKARGANEADKAYYTGKIAAARFFCADTLPRVTTARKIIEAGTLDLMELDEAAF